MSPSRATTTGRPLRAARVVAALATLGWGFFFFGIIDLLVVVIQDERFHDAYLLETGWGLLYTVLVSVPLIALAIRPGSFLLLAQVAAVATAVAVAAVVTPAWDQLIPAAGLFATAAVLSWASGKRPWVGRDVRVRPWTTAHVLTVLAVVAGAAYAVAMVKAARSGVPDDITWGLGHLPMQAALGMSVPAAAGLAAVVRGPGRRVCAWTAGVSASWLGAVSVIYPAHLGSLGRTWGFAAVAWGLVFISVVERSSRPPSAVPHP